MYTEAEVLKFTNKWIRDTKMKTITENYMYTDIWFNSEEILNCKIDIYHCSALSTAKLKFKYLLT